MTKRLQARLDELRRMDAECEASSADFVTTDQLVAATGISARVLAHWAFTGYLKPVYGIMYGMIPRAATRVYSRDQIGTALLMQALHAAGVPLPTARMCLKLRGWKSVQVVDRPMLIGGTLVVPVGKPQTGPKRKRQPVAEPAIEAPEDEALMNQIALQDPAIAQGRVNA